MRQDLKKTRIGQMTFRHQDVYSLLHTYGQTLPQLCAAFEKRFNIPISIDDLEKNISAVVDQTIATRSVGQRLDATYQLA